MRTFERERERDLLAGDCGYRFDLSSDFNESKAVGGLGSSAHCFLATAVQCLLVGFDDPAVELLMKAREWVLVSIAESEIPRRYLNDERYSPDGEAAQRYHTLVLCNWLLQSMHDTDSLKRFVEHEDRFLATSRAGKERRNISLTLSTYVDAGAYQKVLEIFANTRGLIAPKSLSSIRNEGQLSYVICRHHLGLEFSGLEVSRAADRFFARNMDGWLSSGRFVSAAEWMKIVHWREGKAGLSPKESLLKCYDYLPAVATSA